MIITKTFVRVISLLRSVCVDVLKKTSRDFTTLETFPDAEIAILVFADWAVRVERTFHVGASAKMFFHECDLPYHERIVTKIEFNQWNDTSFSLDKKCLVNHLHQRTTRPGMKTHRRGAIRSVLFPVSR